MNNKAASENKLPEQHHVEMKQWFGNMFSQYEGVTQWGNWDLRCCQELWRLTWRDTNASAGFNSTSQPHPPCRLHVLIPNGFYHLNQKQKQILYRWHPCTPCPHVNPASPSAPRTDLAPGHRSPALWVNMNGIISGCCHGVDLFTVHQPTDFKQRTTHFGCHISVSVIIQRTHFHWVI